jgi:hypothetical protein
MRKSAKHRSARCGAIQSATTKLKDDNKMAQGIVNWLACVSMLALMFVEIVRVF